MCYLFQFLIVFTGFFYRDCILFDDVSSVH
jgi:hypothetical protein